MMDDPVLVGQLVEWYKAQDRLAVIAARLEAWAVSVGHDASKMVVPKWAQPVFSRKPFPTDTPRVEEPAQSAMFDIPTVPKAPRKKSLAAIARAAKKRRRAVVEL